MFLRREHLAAFVVAVSLAASAQPTYAQWPVNGAPLCTAPGNQVQPRIVTDGAGGAFVTWQDHRNGTDIGTYAQHVLASGAVDPAWPAGGSALSTPAGGFQIDQNIVTDGAGGAIVTWEDNDLSLEGVYAQRVNAAGVVQWTPDGVAICTAVGSQGGPGIVTDEAGGAIITWNDQRSGTSATYAQRVNAAGVAQWTPDGVAISTGAGGGQSSILTDGAGGAIVTYGKISSSGTGAYAQHVLASGAMDPAWPAGGRGLCTVAGQGGASIVTDGAGGAIAVWQDGRNFGTCLCDPSTYAQRVNAAGVLQWNADGVLLSAAPSYPGQLSVVPDGAGGAIASWADERSGVDIYAQRVNAAGVVQWTPDGVAICTAVGGQDFPTITTDGAGGAIVTWDDRRSGHYDIYAQHVLASGAMDPVWAIDGDPLSTGVGDQKQPTIATDGAGGAIVTWGDSRSGNYDIYAQRVSGSGGITAVALGGPSYSFAVRAPHPNPANSQATISFDLASPQPVSVRVYDETGRLVRTLAAGGELPAGSHSLTWNGASDSGTLAHAGIYFVQVSAGSAIRSRRVAIIR